MTTRIPRKPLGALFKQACDEIPEIVGSMAAGVAGLAIIAGSLTYYYKKGTDNRRYKFLPVVVRPDDPRAKNLRD